MGKEIQQDVKAADPGVLGQLVLDCNAFTLATFGPLQEAAPGGTFAALLGQGVSAEKLLQWFRDYWNGVKSLGYTPFKVNIQMHDGNASCETYLRGRAEGKVYGSPVEETSDDRKKQVAGIESLLRMKLAEEPTPSNPSYDPEGIELCYKMLKNLALRPLFRQAPATPGPGVA